MIPLYIILFLHQTTTCRQAFLSVRCCISYYSYIKPQLLNDIILHGYVVYHTILTSNHNVLLQLTSVLLLYIILFLHQTTTTSRYGSCRCGCISYYSYIKPQPSETMGVFLWVVYHTIPTSNHNQSFASCSHEQVVYHTIPTSNHNFCELLEQFSGLYIILFLHQTTTRISQG